MALSCRLVLLATFPLGCVSLPLGVGVARASKKSDAARSGINLNRKTATASKGPWSPTALSPDTEHRNICQADKQLPDLYVIGQQKCGTSSIAEDLMEAGVRNVHGPFNDKEFHFFDAVTRLDYSLVGEEGRQANINAWYGWMPDCPQPESISYVSSLLLHPPRVVLADFTPGYSSIVPRPEGYEPTGPWLPVYDADANIPVKMRELYGDEASDRLTLAMMIREPLSQMQSAWYHAESFGFTNVCQSCEAASFKDALGSLMNGLHQERPQYTQWLWNVMYARQLEEWLTHFKASQFYIVPTNIYSRGDSTAICNDLTSRLGFSMQCSKEVPDGGEAEGTSHAWTHEHPSLDEDAGEFREQFDAIMNVENDHLVKLLARSNAEGLGLANFAGPVGDEEAVRQWLFAGW